MNCRYVATDQPRVLKGRHLEDCAGGAHAGSLKDGEDCVGCSPCPEAHCRVCGKEHAEQTCAACAGDAREDLHAIAEMCRHLPAEAGIKGVQSEAMALISPAADPEAWGHLTTSLKVGRLPKGYLVCDRCNNPYPCAKHADDPMHPLFVLGTWEQVWRDALDHETDAEATIHEAVRYLDQQLTYMAGYEHAPFEEFARDLNRCRAHLGSVLHDQNQGDRANVGCFECGKDLERRLVGTGFEDVWTCRGCKRRYTVAEYNFALRAKLEAEAS